MLRVIVELLMWGSYSDTMTEVFIVIGAEIIEHLVSATSKKQSRRPKEKGRHERISQFGNSQMIPLKISCDKAHMESHSDKTSH